MYFIKSGNWKTVWTRINWNQLYNAHPRSRVSSINCQLVVTDDDIREKKIETASIFFLYGSSFDIVRWDMTLKKKKAPLSQNRSCIIMILCSSASFF